MAPIIRVARESDVPAMLDIYGPVVLETVISWEVEVPSREEFSGRLAKVQSLGFPWLVAEHDGKVVGYCYASPFRERYGYRFCCESTVYVHKDFRSMGVGLRLYETLFEVLRRQSFAVVVAGIAYPTPESEGFHRRFGFTRVGMNEGIGFKFGEWRSVAFYQRDLRHRDSIQVEEPTPFETLLAEGRLGGLIEVKS